MNANRRDERRSSPPRTEPAVCFAPVVDQCKWVRPDSFAAAYCVAMGWERLVSEPDGQLYRAPAGFVAHAVERLPMPSASTSTDWSDDLRGAA